MNNWRTGTPKGKGALLDCMESVPNEYRPRWVPKNNGERSQWISEARAAYWDDAQGRQKKKRSRKVLITASECNKMLRELGPPPLYGEDEVST